MEAAGGEGVTISMALTRRSTLLGAALLGGCQVVPDMTEDLGPKLSANRTGYLLFEAPITPQSRDFFVQDTEKLLALKATALTIFLNSPGGLLKPAQDMSAHVERMQARGIEVAMHNVGLVASAACYVFLAAQRRLSIADGTFLFHQAALTANATLTSQDIQELAVQLQRTERALTDIITSRTRITPAEATSFTRRTVVLSATEALRDGVIDGIGPAAVPKGARNFVIRAKSKPGAPAPVTPAATGGT